MNRTFDNAQLHSDDSTNSMNRTFSIPSSGKDFPRQRRTRSLREISSLSLRRKSQGSCNTVDSDGMRRLSTDSSAAFCVKRSPKSEYMEQEEIEELRNLLSKRTLEAIKEDAVNEVAMIIDNINAELEGNESKIINQMLNDVILCLLLQLPECNAYSLSNNVIKLMVYWQSILHFSGFLIEFQSIPLNSVLGMF